MPELQIGENSVEVDDMGFIINPDDWSEEVAAMIAMNSSLYPLTEEHWRVIRYIRNYYETYSVAPMLQLIVKRTRINEKKLFKLFPSSCRECMCKVAGLPQPTG